MTEATRKKPAAKSRAAAPRQERAAAPASALEDHAALYGAVDAFVRENSNFESSFALDAALADAGRSPDLQALFQVPLQHKILSMEGALRWLLFLHVAPARAVQEGDAPFSEGVQFSPAAALDLVAQIYDVGLQEAAWEHFEAEEEDEDDEDGEGDEDGGADETA